MKGFILLFLLPMLSYSFEVSYQLVDISKDNVVAHKASTKPMILASVSKIYTFNYVLSQLHENDTFETKIFISKDAKIKNGFLDGDLLLYSNGDPYITAQNLISLIYQVKDFGIQKVKGRFIILQKDHWFSDRLSTLGLEDQADNPSMGNFNVEFNRFKVERGQKTPTPPLDYLKLSNHKMNQPGLKYRLKNKTNSLEHWVKNTEEGHKNREDLPARNSLLFSGHYFKYLASLHALELPEPLIKKSAKQGETIATHQSLPLFRLVELGMEYSNNIIAEMLLQKVHPTSPKIAAKKMHQWYQDNTGELASTWKNVSLVNGSGISLNNKSTANNLSRFLAKIIKQKTGKRKMISYLSQSGHSGGLKRRLASPKLTHHVYGKTGSLFYVNNLAGYLRGKSGKMYAFSIFTTDETQRRKLSKPNSKKVNQVRQSAKAYYGKSNEKIDRLLNKWIMAY